MRPATAITVLSLGLIVGGCSPRIALTVRNRTERPVLISLGERRKDDLFDALRIRGVIAPGGSLTCSIPVDPLSTSRQLLLGPWPMRTPECESLALDQGLRRAELDIVEESGRPVFTPR